MTGQLKEEMGKGPKVFFAPKLTPQARFQTSQRLAKENPHHFPDPASVSEYLSHIVTPTSRRWAYMRIGKTGTSSTLRSLFEMEFGTPLTARVVLPNDINRDAEAHHLIVADVFRPLSQFARPFAEIDDALRLVTVRNPLDRAVSAFSYLCKTQRESHHWLSTERLRMNALVGFDWTQDPGTQTGFLKFLQFVRITLDEGGPEMVNNHWRPMIDHIKPALYRPDLVGRTEDLGAFLRQVSDRLSQPLPKGWEPPASNADTNTSGRADLVSQAARRLATDIYAADFEHFGYDP